MSITVPLRGFGGNGASLNFKVVGGTVPPANPKENTIWVNTDKEISNWVFSATDPSNLIDGMVWIMIDTSSPVAFNAIKKNDIQIYPLSAKQYNNGKWEDKAAKIYQNGAWKEFLDNYTLVPGVGVFSGVSGVTENADGTYEFHATNAGYMVTSVDVTKYKTMSIKGSYSTFKGQISVGLFSEKSLASFITGHNNTFGDGGGTIDNSYDISSVTGNVFFGVCGMYAHEETQYINCTLTEVIFKP